jgi:hypothetical protein
MNAQTARSLIAGQKIKYWDDRIATVTIPWTDPPGEVCVTFDDDERNPKSVIGLKDVDFMRAEPTV